MRCGDRLELFVEKLLFGGAGLARIDCEPASGKDGISGAGPAKVEGFPVFVDNAVPQEKVLAEIISVNKNFAKAKILEIIEPSSARVKPFCAMANVCGGCSWQNVDYKEQLKQKNKL